MVIRAIRLGIEKDKIEELTKLYLFDDTDDFIARYKDFDDELFIQKFCIGGKDNSKCRELLLRLRERRLLKQVFTCRVNEFRPDVRDVLAKMIDERQKIASDIETSIAEEISKLTGQKVDLDFVIINAFNIRSVRETSRNDEAGILIAGEAGQPPKPFEDESTLFASINERYADEFVEVYAPIEWNNETEKKTIRRKLREPIFKIIEDNTLQTLKDLENEHV
jgi:hypothetical protein